MLKLGDEADERERERERMRESEKERERDRERERQTDMRYTALHKRFKHIGHNAVQ